MPGFDRTGPAGAGPMTGGRRGLCGRAANTAALPPYAGYGYGRGMGFRRGGGRGFGPGRGLGRGLGRGYGRGVNGMRPAYPADDAMGMADERELLKAEHNAMQKSLEAIRKRIEELDQAESAE